MNKLLAAHVVVLMERQLNVSYVDEKSRDYSKDRHKLDVFYSEGSKDSSVLIFIHGGTWISGSKDLYRDLGKNLVRKGITSVLINYRLATDFRKMAGDCAQAVLWVYDNISRFGGNKERIFLCGHSAGGHLASLIALDSTYFSDIGLANPVKGCILIDAFGLNIGAYIADHGAFYMHYISQVFSSDPDLWKKASPVNFVKDVDIRFLMYTGTESYPFLIEDNKTFIRKLQQLNLLDKYIEVEGRSHMEMVTALRNGNDSVYNDIVEFTGKLQNS